MTLQRPATDEHDSYYSRYIDLAPGGEIFGVLSAEVQKTRHLLTPLAEEDEVYRYAPGKWSLREIVGHLIDTESVFAYRALAFARQDPAELPDFDQDLWAATSNAHDRPLAELLDAFALVRENSLALYRGFDEAIWLRTGIASSRSFTVRSIPYIVAGHEIHHRNVIEERYLPGLRTDE